MTDFTRHVTGISSLADDLRRQLYLLVCSQSEPVGRDQAAKALGIPAHQAKFHLDRLEEAGLLESEYVRLTGRSGPGAGRPAKVYRRRGEEIAVSLPRRDYALAGELMAAAIEESAVQGTPILEALDRAAGGRAAGIEVVAAGDPLRNATETLRGLGYEPRDEDGTVVMANCPFHALARTHTELVCTMNLALLGGLCERIGGIDARLEPAPGRCCVVLTPAGSATPDH